MTWLLLVPFVVTLVAVLLVGWLNTRRPMSDDDVLYSRLDIEQRLREGRLP